MEEQVTTTQPEPEAKPDPNAGRHPNSIIKRPVLKYGKRGRPKTALVAETHSERQMRYLRNVATKNSIVHQKEDGIGALAEAIAQFPGGMKKFLPFVRACVARDESLGPVVDAFFNSPPTYRSAYTLERICKELEVNPSHLLGVCVEVAHEHHANVTKMLSYLAMPKVMKRNITEALKPSGTEDRRMFMTSTGLLPVPKGSTINVSANAQAASMTTDGQPSGLPSFEDSTNTFSEIIRNAVETPKRLPEPIDVTPEE